MFLSCGQILSLVVIRKNRFVGSSVKSAGEVPRNIDRSLRPRSGLMTFWIFGGPSGVLHRSPLKDPDLFLRMKTGGTKNILGRMRQANGVAGIVGEQIRGER